MNLLYRIIIWGLATLMLSTYAMPDIIVSTEGRFSVSFCHNIPYIGGSCSGTSISQPSCNLDECEDQEQNEELKKKYTEFVSDQQERKNRDPYSFLPSKYTLLIANAHYVIVPKDVFTMAKLTEVKIIQSKLRKINLNDFLTLPNLKKIHLTNNTINVIESNEQSNINSTVEDIDLSFNFLEIVPNNFVRSFNRLKHLNMSHNMISSIDNLAFEGTEQLESLDLSYNKLKEVEHNIFSQLPRLTDTSEATGNLKRLSKLFLDYNLLDSVDFAKAFETGLSELSIGGNKISCNDLALVKYYSKLAEKFNRIVTARNLILSTDGNNINGITCQKKEGGIAITADYPSSNTIILIKSLKNELEDTRKQLEVVGEGVMTLFESLNKQIIEIKKNLPDKCDLE